MENEQFTTLVNTLLSNNLAASPSEARRMAEDMIGTSAKVQDSFRKENRTYMISNFRERDDEPVQQAEPARQEASVGAQQAHVPDVTVEMPARSSETLHNNIQELRNRAINPQPVNVQVDFQTPGFDARQKVAGETITSQPEATFAPQVAQEAPAQQQASTSTQDLMNNFSVNIPGVDTTQSLSNLTGESHTPQEVTAPTREKDDFLTVRVEAQGEQTPSSSPEARLQAQAQPTTNSQQNNYSQPEPTFPQAQQQNNIPTGFPEQAPQVAPEQVAPQPTPQPAASEQKEDRWTPEERKLREDCDLSKVFNFSGK